MKPYTVIIDGTEVDLRKDKKELKTQLGFYFEYDVTQADPNCRLSLFKPKKINRWISRYYSMNTYSSAVVCDGVANLMPNDKAAEIIGNNGLFANSDGDRYCYKAFVGETEIDYSKINFNGISEDDPYRVEAIKQGIDAYCQHKAEEIGADFYTVIGHGLSSAGCVINFVTIYTRKKGLLKSLKK